MTEEDEEFERIAREARIRNFAMESMENNKQATHKMFNPDAVNWKCKCDTCRRLYSVLKERYNKQQTSGGHR